MITAYPTRNLGQCVPRRSAEAVRRTQQFADANGLKMPRLRALDITLNVNYSPYVVILGAGASLDACPRGDANGQRLPVMANLMPVLGLEPLPVKAGLEPSATGNFELLYDRISSDDAYRDLRVEVDVSVRRYFESLQLPEDVTLYDEFLLSLRPKDLVATFNWDPLLLQAYARNRHLRLPRIVFLHGNVYLGYCPEHRAKGYLTQNCATCGQLFEPSPLLFLILRKQYRSHPLLAKEWDELVATLQHAYLLTIFGYAAPSSDAVAREIFVNAWDENETRELAQIEVIDILPSRLLYKRWSDFIVSHHWARFTRFSHTWQHNHLRRSCETFAFATLQQHPWETTPIPRFRQLDRLHEWIRPFLKEEALDEEKVPLTRIANAP
jgi:hypothetical protein